MGGYRVSWQPGLIGLVVLPTFFTAALAVPAGAAPGAASQATAPPPEVTVTELPHLPAPGGEPVPGVPLVYDVNSHGQVVGTSGGRAVLWDRGEPSELPASIARRINDRGDVLLSASSTDYHWFQGELTRLPDQVIDVEDLNDRGQVLVETSSGSSGVWTDGVLTAIDVPPAPPRPGYDAATMLVSDLSDAGHVALTWVRCLPNGWPFRCYNEPPAVWQDGRILTRLAEESRPLAVNDTGQVITTSGTLWTGGRPTPLGMQPTDINDRGQVVGSIAVGDQRHAALWEDGLLIDLGALGAGNSEATEINELGHVIGTSDGADGQTHAVLWVDDHIVDLGLHPPVSTAPFALADGGYVTGTLGPTLQDPKAQLWEVHGGGASGDPLEPACFTATNATHVQAGRAVSWLAFSWAVGSNQYLGLTSQTTALRESSPGRWELTTGC